MYFRYSKPALIGLLAFACIFIIAGVTSYFLFPTVAGKFIQSAGYMLATAGFFQLDVSGFFESIAGVYSDDKSYPYGPPAYINRMVTIVPDNRFVRKLWEYFTFNTRAAIHLFMTGNILGLIGTWI